MKKNLNIETLYLKMKKKKLLFKYFIFYFNDFDRVFADTGWSCKEVSANLYLTTQMPMRSVTEVDWSVKLKSVLLTSKLIVTDSVIAGVSSVIDLDNSADRLADSWGIFGGGGLSCWKCGGLASSLVILCDRWLRCWCTMESSAFL